MQEFPKNELFKKFINSSKDAKDSLFYKRICDFTSIQAYTGFLFFESQNKESRLSKIGLENVCHIATFCGDYGVTQEEETREFVNKTLSNI